MPLLVNTGTDDLVYPNNKPRELDLGGIDIRDFQIRTDLFYIDVKKY